MNSSDMIFTEPKMGQFLIGFQWVLKKFVFYVAQISIEKIVLRTTTNTDINLMPQMFSYIQYTYSHYSSRIIICLGNFYWEIFILYDKNWFSVKIIIIY